MSQCDEPLDVASIFTELDDDADGFISANELMCGMLAKGYEEEEVSKLLEYFLFILNFNPCAQGVSSVSAHVCNSIKGRFCDHHQL